MSLDISKMGFAFSTKLVAEEGRKVKFMYRESPDHPDDSGWRFFCGEESQEYVDDPDNTGIFSVSVIAEANPSIIDLLATPAPCAFERDDENKPFVESDFDYWPEE